MTSFCVQRAGGGQKRPRNCGHPQSMPPVILDNKIISITLMKVVFLFTFEAYVSHSPKTRTDRGRSARGHYFDRRLIVAGGCRIWKCDHSLGLFQPLGARASVLGRFAAAVFTLVATTTLSDTHLENNHATISNNKS